MAATRNVLISDTEFDKLKKQYLYLGRLLPVAFYGENHSPISLLQALDDFRKLIIGACQNG